MADVGDLRTAVRLEPSDLTDGEQTNERREVVGDGIGRRGTLDGSYERERDGTSREVERELEQGVVLGIGVGAYITSLSVLEGLVDEDLVR